MLLKKPCCLQELEQELQHWKQSKMHPPRSHNHQPFLTVDRKAQGVHMVQELQVEEGGRFGMYYMLDRLQSVDGDVILVKGRVCNAPPQGGRESALSHDRKN